MFDPRESILSLIFQYEIGECMNSGAILVGNIKGGVGKSMLAAFMTDFLRQKFRYHEMKVIDADPQGTAFEMLEPLFPRGSVRHLGVGGRYDGVNLVTLDSLLRSYLNNDDHLVMIDSGAGTPDSLFQAIMACRCVLVPVSLSWADIRPTVDFIKLIQERKDQTSQACPHIIVVPNRVPPRQRDISEIANAMRGLDVVIAPGLSEISAVRKQAGAFTGLTGLKGTRYYDEFEKLGNFICDYVLSGKIDSMFDKTATQQGNVIRLQT